MIFLVDRLPTEPVFFIFHFSFLIRMGHLYGFTKSIFKVKSVNSHPSNSKDRLIILGLILVLTFISFKIVVNRQDKPTK